MIERLQRDDEERKRIGSIIQVLRVQHGLTVEELGKKACLSSSVLASVELGKFNVRLDILSSIAGALGYEVNFVKKE